MLFVLPLIPKDETNTFFVNNSMSAQRNVMGWDANKLEEKEGSNFAQC